jgi:hemoglobin
MGSTDMGDTGTIRTVAARQSAFEADIKARTGIDEEMIRKLVHSFYDRVRSDAVLGPIFAASIENWGPHLERMCAFWSSVILMTGCYHGRPMQKHAPLPMGGDEFDRWLALFAETARSVCPSAAAEYFIESGQVLSLKVFNSGWPLNAACS